MATPSSILSWKIPWRVEPGGYSPWGCKESDMTKHTHTHTHTHTRDMTCLSKFPSSQGSARHCKNLCFLINEFVWLHWVLAETRGLFDFLCSMRNLVP